MIRRFDGMNLDRLGRMNLYGVSFDPGDAAHIYGLMVLHKKLKCPQCPSGEWHLMEMILCDFIDLSRL